jgi:hypothetical protein
VAAKNICFPALVSNMRYSIGIKYLSGKLPIYLLNCLFLSLRHFPSNLIFVIKIGVYMNQTILGTTSFDRKSVGQTSFSQHMMVTSVGQNVRTSNVTVNRKAYIIHQCRKTTVLSCHRCLINPGVEKWTTFQFGVELWPPDVSKKSQCWYSNICLHFLEHAVPLKGWEMC